MFRLWIYRETCCISHFVVNYVHFATVFKINLIFYEIMLLNILWIAPSKMCLPIYWTYFSLGTNSATYCKLDKICISNTCFGLKKLVSLDTITGCKTSRFDRLYCVFSMALPFKHLCRQVNIQMTECRIFVFCSFCQFNTCAEGCWS